MKVRKTECKIVCLIKRQEGLLRMLSMVREEKRDQWRVYVQFLLTLFGLGFLRCLGLVVIGEGGSGGGVPRPTTLKVLMILK